VLQRAVRQEETVVRVVSSALAYSVVEVEGALACRMRELLTARDGAPTFAMRQFEVSPGGHTPYHSHPWEHEVFVLSGTGLVRLEGDEAAISAGDAVLIAPGETHSFQCVGEEALIFLCLIPVAEACCR